MRIDGRVRANSARHAVLYHGLKVLLVVLVVYVVASLLSPLVTHNLFFRMPAPSAEFDCDDAVLVMLDRLSQVGITATPILGTLTTTGEAYWESDHVWLLADVAGLRVPLDWGVVRFGGQYYEGFPLNRQQLVEFVVQDRKAPDKSEIPARRGN